MGQAPAESYIERMKHTKAKSHDSKSYRVTGVKVLSSDAIISWSEKTALFGVATLISQPSLSGYASNQDMFYR